MIVRDFISSKGMLLCCFQFGDGMWDSMLNLHTLSSCYVGGTDSDLYEWLITAGPPSSHGRSGRRRTSLIDYDSFNMFLCKFEAA